MLPTDYEFRSAVRDAGIDFLQINDQRLQEILRLAEVKLEAQRSTAIAADQRALAMAGIITTFTVAAVGAGGKAYIDQNWSLFFSMTSLVIYFSVAMFFSFRAFWPTGFEFAGNEPGEWVTKEDLTGSWSMALSQQCDFYDRKIKYNDRIMQKNGYYTKVAIFLLALSPLAMTLTLAIGNIIDPFIFLSHWKA